MTVPQTELGQFEQKLHLELLMAGLSIRSRPADSLVVDVLERERIVGVLDHAAPLKGNDIILRRVFTPSDNGKLNQMVDKLLLEQGIYAPPSEADVHTKDEYGMRFFYDVAREFEKREPVDF